MRLLSTIRSVRGITMAMNEQLAWEMHVLMGLPVPPEPPVVAKKRSPPVSEVYIAFDKGTIEGSCDGCDAETVGRAFVAIGKKLLALAKEGYSPKYYDYDEGKHFSG